MSEFTFTDANFDADVLKSDKPVLVDFFADWCGPCKMQGPIIEEVAKEAGDGVKVGKFDVDANPEIAGKFNVMSIPTLIIFKGGKPVETMNGVQTKEVLLEKLGKLS
jgi:thioredoxin 1